MLDYLLHNFKMYCPSEATRAVSYEERYGDELVVRLEDGTRVLYDDAKRTIRRLPANSREMTEYEVRREFGKRLAKMIDRSGMTQAELSEKTGISQPRICNYIFGRNLPNLYNLDKLAKALNCSVDDFRYID